MKPNHRRRALARSRRRYGQNEECEPSRFIEELPADDIEWLGVEKDTERGRQEGEKTLSNLRQMLQT